MFNRWLVVLGSICIQICLGAVYGWSLFNQPLQDKFGWDKEAIVITFSITIAVFALFTIIAGKVQDMIGPRWVASAGGVLLGIGLILSSYATSLMQLYVFYGVIGGAGIGIAYVCPLATCIKWFPEKRGFISGVAVGGFGAGGLIFKPIIVYLIEQFGVSSAFFYLGVIYLLLVVGGAQFLINPSINSKHLDNGSADPFKRQLSPTEMLRTKQFYFLWVMFLFGCTSGLMVISFAVDIGMQLVQLDLQTAGNAVMVIALFNASGRILLGMLSDRIGRQNTLTFIYGLTAIMMFCMSTIPMTYLLFLFFVSVVGFCFGGFLSIFPSVTTDLYGTQNIGVNYGLMYQAYGLAAFVGPMIANATTFTRAFLISAGLCVIALFMSRLVTPPKS
ncbi:OFA family oxalate/formate antiporter-like MFS transporter [Salirhabdus euzebyi]|uniref:OFA family oxalate/formate antiporter-like MFS transporter n=1 Tax=Salirhabdus euzebyi TaxID=394506 RepID=A0A841PXH9_9BACI|nr:OFA family MFS transporter [Salirhabdus euzebyi]MBB6452744.1 OFA family oxalate/formate antiporter-like MFS transporter [Salirhabdus euzebyi]